MTHYLIHKLVLLPLCLPLLLVAQGMKYERGRGEGRPLRRFFSPLGLSPNDQLYVGCYLL